MKNLIIINGTMGVGKTATCNELRKLVENSAFLDGDWCWDLHPFIVNDETKEMVIENICFLLNQYIHCSSIKNIIFCWVMHEQSIIDAILKKLDTKDLNIKIFSLIADVKTIESRLRKDVKSGKRDESVIIRSLERIDNYYHLDTVKIDTNNISPLEVAKIILKTQH